MLETIKIKNIAVIDQAEIPFKKGLNILSGETGAGKSIVIEAISLLLGGRAHTDLIRTGCEEAVVEGLFDIKQLDWAQRRMDRHGFGSEGGELLIKRIIAKSGKHRIYVNGELCTLSILQDLCEGLIDLCGQNEHQSLLKPSVQLDLVDRYGGLTDKAHAFSLLHSRVRGLRRELETLKAAEDDRARREDFLSFQIEELKSANLESGEDERLSLEKTLLQSVEKRASLARSIDSLLSQQEGGTGATEQIRAALTAARQLAAIDTEISPLCEGLERASAELEDASLTLSRYQRGLNAEPDRLTEIQERLAVIAALRRKYGTSIDEMLATLAQLQNEQGQLASTAEQITAIDRELETLGRDLKKQGVSLSDARAKASKLLADSVTAEIADLKMADAKLTVEITPIEAMEEWSSTGRDQIQFTVRTNRGEQAKALAKIASGGELSRIMLAIRRVISDRGGIGVYLFDEIDAGIGGQTAFQVGKKLKSVAQFNQVICITHLAQVASFADHHLVVKKTAQGTRTRTEVEALETAKLKKEEIARMLGGEELTKKSLDNAAELIAQARL